MTEEHDSGTPVALTDIPGNAEPTPGGWPIVEPSVAPSIAPAAPAAPRSQARWLLVAATSAVVVLGAVVLEVVAGSGANSPAPAWAWAFPLAGPQAARVAWRSAVAVAAGAFRLALVRLGIRQHPVIVVASVLPFLIFAARIATGASWSTWH
jgi:hypothetical protein